MAINEDGSRRIALQKDGWRSLAHLNSHVDGFEASIRQHLRQKRLKHHLNSGGFRDTNYYLLTTKGAAWARLNQPELLGAFGRRRAMDLEVTREQLQAKGWFPLVYTDGSEAPDIMLLKRRLIETKPFIRGQRTVTYYRITPAGLRFAKRALSREARRRYENSICGVTDPVKIKSLKDEQDAWLKYQVSQMDGYALVRMANSSQTLIPALLADFRA